MSPTRMIGSTSFETADTDEEQIASTDDKMWYNFGSHVFKGVTAEPYLRKHKLPPNVLLNSKWTVDGKAEKVAEAVLDWARDNNVSSYCHWFQPMASAGVRHGQTGQVHNSLIEFDRDNKPIWKFSAKQLLAGETDGSSYLNGGLRATHTAGAYTMIDPTSPMFIRGDTLFIPSCLISYYGKSLDEKLPLLRATDAMSREAVRLLGHLGYNVNYVYANIGLEQEFFLVPREMYCLRPDLQLTGRTIVGKMPPRGQEMNDHYMAPLSHANPAFGCIQAVQNAAYHLGIPLRTRHREVAPNQFEMAPMYGPAPQQIDQNLMVMQLLEETAAMSGLAALLQEKPFQGINGSGKHNNWSLSTDDGTNLLNVKELEKKSGSGAIFPVIMAAILKAIYKHGDLMRMSIASPGNDFRLGACEAPPAIITTHLGEDMTNYLEGYKNGKHVSYDPQRKTIDLGVSVLPPLEVPAEDRNRTSPFPYGGHRFEFRAVGSSQNVSMVNTVLAAIVADSFREFSEAIEKGEKPHVVAQRALQESWNVIFNGNGYDPANQDMLTNSGVWRIDSGVEAICRLTATKNVEMFRRLKVFDAEECEARQNVMLKQYIGVVEVEANCLMELLQQRAIPAVKEAQIEDPAILRDLEDAVTTLRTQFEDFHAGGSILHAAAYNKLDDDTSRLRLKAELARVLRLETMEECRAAMDRAEGVVPPSKWGLATYKDLLFLDQNTVPPIVHG